MEYLIFITSKKKKEFKKRLIIRQIEKKNKTITEVFNIICRYTNTYIILMICPCIQLPTNYI